MKELANQVDLAAASASQAGSRMADAAGEPIAAGAVGMVEGRWADAMRQVSTSLREDADLLQRSAHNYQQADQDAAQAADNIVNRLLGGG
jgi:hypothetical protein